MTEFLSTSGSLPVLLQKGTARRKILGRGDLGSELVQYFLFIYVFLRDYPIYTGFTFSLSCHPQ